MITESGFMEKPGIEPATPGLQGIDLSPTPFCAFPGHKPVPTGWFKMCVCVCVCVLVLCREHPKAYRKWFNGEAGTRTCGLWLTRHRLIPYTFLWLSWVLISFAGLVKDVCVCVCVCVCVRVCVCVCVLVLCREHRKAH